MHQKKQGTCFASEFTKMRNSKAEKRCALSFESQIKKFFLLTLINLKNLRFSLEIVSSDEKKKEQLLTVGDQILATAA